ncbi:MAG: hypothetical protein WCC90_22110, partial [Methylocella sp.]
HVGSLRLRRDGAFSRATFGDSSAAATRSSFIFLRIWWSGISTPARRQARGTPTGWYPREIREYSICRSAMGIDPRNRRIGDFF